MPSCCQCNASGQCKNFSCKKSKRRCLNCLPSRQGHCANSTPATDHHAGELGQNPAPTADALERLDASEKNGNPSQTAAAGFTPSQDMDFTPILTTRVPLVEAIVNGVRDTSTDNTPPTLVKDLPAYIPSTTANFKWGEVDGETFAHSIHAIYDEIVNWKRNLFKTPSGKAGKLFVQELTRLFTAYAESSALESISLKAAMVMPTLLLQKPHQRSKSKDIRTHLERRLKLWSQGNLEDLMSESRTIQKISTQMHHKSRQPQETARRFAKLMMQGKVKAALRLIKMNEMVAHYNSMAEWIPQRLKQFKMPSQKNTHRNSPQSHLPLSHPKHHQMSLTLYVLKKSMAN